MRVNSISIKYFAFIWGISTLIISTSCKPKTNIREVPGTNTTTIIQVFPTPNPFTIFPPGNNPGTGFGTGNEPGVADAGQTLEYNRINDPLIVVHGQEAGVVVWNSQFDLPSSIGQDIFLTNSRFNLRVIPRNINSQNDSRGANCRFTNQFFTKLSIGVRVRKRGTTTGSYFSFEQIPVNSASPVHEFSVPLNTTDPLVVEILNVQWDYSCTAYQSDPFLDPFEFQNYCPMAPRLVH